MLTATWEQVNTRRLQRGALLDPAPSIAEAVRGTCGLQAQLLSAAELGAGLRVAGVRREDVRAELWERRTLVRLTAQRGTIHVLPADELPVWVAALRGPHPYWHTREWRERYDVTPERADALVSAIADALDGVQLTREELAVEASARAGSWARTRLTSGWGELLAPAAYSGLLCHGPPRGGTVTFVRADQWIGGWREVDPHEALVEIVRRYLHTYGPTRPRDVSRWLGVELPRVEAALEELDLEEVRIERRRAQQLAGDEFPDPGASVRLLPKYDCYVLGCYPRESIVPIPVRDALRAHPRGRFESASGHWVLVVDGLVAGMWERQGKEIRIDAFTRLSRGQQRQAEEDAARIGAFLGLDASISFAPLT
ncbi:MAG: winged helix DNA-binding domain-containing protein [Gaiellaceae bacterium]